MYAKFATAVASHAGKDQTADRAAVTAGERMVEWKRRALAAQTAGNTTEALECWRQWFVWSENLVGYSNLPWKE